MIPDQGNSTPHAHPQQEKRTEFSQSVPVIEIKSMIAPASMLFAAQKAGSTEASRVVQGQYMKCQSTLYSRPKVQAFAWQASDSLRPRPVEIFFSENIPDSEFCCACGLCRYISVIRSLHVHLSHRMRGSSCPRAAGYRHSSPQSLELTGLLQVFTQRVEGEGEKLDSISLVLHARSSEKKKRADTSGCQKHGQHTGKSGIFSLGSDFRVC